MSLPPPSAQGTALITGASSGIGAALAQALAERGYGTVLVGRDPARLGAVAEDAARHGGRVETVEADLAEASGRRLLAERVERSGLTVDILVNAAGAATRTSVAECDVASELAHIALNVTTVVELCRRYVDGMLARKSGAILNVSSVAAFRPLAGQGTYAASKAFVLSFSRTLALELQDSPVTVTALCPGPVPTPFARTAGFSEEEIAAVPRVMWVAADKVAATAISAMEQGAELCIPGRPNVIDAAMCLQQSREEASQAVSRATPRP
ncbi:SDR family NAD(P)-dependent oxidoreductase [Streptomyces sp. NPDC093252]|uniref:SDR family NAD(P)-dependent oxidoreductase n=1 Tax=Streptomyces sp. NPDC093252 TaxID=3154980 RepID=UPI0034321269